MADPTASDYEALMRRYFDACNAADFDALVACFTPDAVHYFPPGLAGVPWRSALPARMRSRIASTVSGTSTA